MIGKGQKVNDRYQIIRSIGEGGMANVYLALDTILNREVAVKILRGDLAEDEKFVRRFQREAISASSLSHPNIVEMYDVGEDDGKYFIVMEYVEGKTLKSLIKKRGALTIHEVIDILLQLTAGIACAHDSYIIHRDIKPQNVLIKDNGIVKITDFGIAMAINSQELTQTNSVMGSVHYLPPEQANGSGATMKSDIYSLGILMYELLTGKVPFKGDNAVEIAIKQMKDQIPSICQSNPDIPQSIENIILRACAKNPKNRYDSVVEMHEDIKKALNENHKNDSRLVYSFPDYEVDETKEVPNLKELEKKEVSREENMNKNKKINIILGVIVFLCVLFITAFAALIIVYPKISEVPDVLVPDVANLTVAEATAKLEKVGLKVNAENVEENSELAEGIVISSYPNSSVKVKKGKEITLHVSIGLKYIVLEDYIGANYYEVKTLLETEGLYVLTEKETTEDDTLKEYSIIKQSLPEGSKLLEGDTITLTIPDIFTEYPDFKEENWSIDDIRTFCEEYNITLTIAYEQTEVYTEGTIISQSRTPKSRVMTFTSLKIVIAQAPDLDIEDPIEGE